MNTTTLPVAVIGAGPVGLAAAAHLLAKGETPIILEAGATVGTAIRRWGHVRLFSPWRYLVDSEATKLLHAAGWTDPEPEALPTGHDLVDRYLQPLAELPTIRPHLRLGMRVVAVARQGFDKMKTPGRDDAPFVLTVQTADGAEEQIVARAVIDASGTYDTPNPLGANGLPALGEPELADHVFYGIPDVLGRERARYVGKRVLVVGSGHSAFNALLDLAQLAADAPGTSIVWAVRRDTLGQVFGGGDSDALPERGKLGARLQQVITAGTLQVALGVRIDRVRRAVAGIVVESGGAALPEVDEIIATTGFRPDLALLRELRLDLDPATESPRALAPLIDPNVHSCGTVPPHGYAELQQPETGLYLVGMKSYGRAPTFLMLTGYEQVRSIVCALTGDLVGARQVELVLPATGVCSSDLGGGSCCASPALPVVTSKWGKALPVLAASTDA